MRGDRLSKPKYGWWGYVKDMIRRYPGLEKAEVYGNALKEKEAVKAAVSQTEALDNGKDRIALVNMVFWKKTHTLEGAALKVHCSKRTAQEWHRQFIRLVAKNFGLLD